MKFPSKALNRTLQWLASAMLALAAGSAAAQQPGDSVADRTDPEQVLAYQGDAVLTQQEIDAAFSRIPDEHRLLFIRDGAKVDQLVRSLLEAKIVSADARKAGFADDPLMRARLALAVEKELADAWNTELARRAPEADYEAMAHEDYLANPGPYSTGVLLDVSHILIGTDDRTLGEAEALARDLKTRLDENPSEFDALVMQYSDDPAKANNQGRYLRMRRGMMVRPFERAAFALETPGQITEPVLTDYGYHIIRLDARHEPVTKPWDDVKAEATARARQKHVNAYRARYLQKLLIDPVMFPDGAVEVMARRHFGENLEKAPSFNEGVGSDADADVNAEAGDAADD